MQHLNYLGILFIVFSFYACENEDLSRNSSSKKLFTKLESSYTGLHFENALSLEEQADYINYEYNITGAGVAVGDINGDGLEDLFICGNKVSDKLYLNKGNFQFEDVTIKSGIDISPNQWSTGVTIADINMDGFLDIYVCRSGNLPAVQRANALYINNGDGTFLEQAQKLGLDDKGHSTQAAFLDYDLDGDLDVYVINHQDDFDAVQPFEETNQRGLYSDRLYQNQNGIFKDVSIEAGIENDRYGFGLGIAVADYNKDGYPDIYISNDFFEHEYFYVNQGDGTFKQLVHESMKHTSFSSMGCDMADYDNDGWVDIMSVDMVAEDNLRQKNQMAGMNPDIFWEAVDSGLHYQYMFNALQRNNGDGSFSDLAD